MKKFIIFLLFQAKYINFYGNMSQKSEKKYIILCFVLQKKSNFVSYFLRKKILNKKHLSQKLTSPKLRAKFSYL